jgi:hypothetical protein
MTPPVPQSAMLIAQPEGVHGCGEQQDQGPGKLG